MGFEVTSELFSSDLMMLVAHGEYFHDDSVSCCAKDFRWVPCRQVIFLVIEVLLLYVVLLK